MSVPNHSSPVLGRLIAATLALAALGAPASALAQSSDTSAREAALEARVAELEKMVNELVKERQTPVPAAAPADSGARPPPEGEAARTAGLDPAERGAGYHVLRQRLHQGRRELDVHAGR